MIKNKFLRSIVVSWWLIVLDNSSIVFILLILSFELLASYLAWLNCEQSSFLVNRHMMSRTITCNFITPQMVFHAVSLQPSGLCILCQDKFQVTHLHYNIY